MSSHRLKDAAYAFLAVGAMAVVLLVVFVLVAIRQTQQTGSPIMKAVAAQQTDIKRAADNAQETNEQLLDCLQPGGKCYKESRRNQSETVASLNTIVYYTAACADRDGVQTIAEIKACVLKRLGR